MSKFEQTYKEIMEMVVGDVFGGEEHGGDLMSSDWYATGDARVPSYLGARKKKKKKNKKKDEVEVEVPVSRRTFPES